MTQRRRTRGRRPAPEPPTTGAAAQDAEPDPHDVARSIALQQLTEAPRSRAQLREAMDRRDVPADVAAAVLDRFTEVGLVDDAAYARSLVASKRSSRGLARRALAHELRAKGVDDDTARDALDEVDADDELAIARDLVRRRLPTTRRLARDARTRRLSGMLARKGYPTGVAMRVVREALDAEGGADVDDAAAADEVEAYD